MSELDEMVAVGYQVAMETRLGFQNQIDTLLVRRLIIQYRYPETVDGA